MLAEGLTEPQMAKQLGISRHSVKSARNRIYVKLGAVNIAHAVAIGYQKGLLQLIGIELMGVDELARQMGYRFLMVPLVDEGVEV